MSNTGTLPKQTSEDVIPNIGLAAGANKVWCRDMERIRPSDTFSELMRITYLGGDGNIILKKITSDSPTYTSPSNMDKIYIDTFPTLFKEKQQKSEVTNLLTPDVTREIYIKIGEIIQNVYAMNNLIDKAFLDVTFNSANTNSTNTNNITDSIKNTYKTHFSKDEVINIFEL